VTSLRTALLVTTCLCAACVLWLLPATASALPGHEWQHALWVAEQLRDNPPDGPVALLLGGSCAREALMNDAAWAADVQRLGGMRVTTYDLGSRLQTFQQDVALVKTLPKIPMVVFIGINAGRFTSQLTATTEVTPPAADPSWVRHHYKTADAWSLERKRVRVEFWVEHRQRVFDERFADNATQLDQLIGECVRRGYVTVVLALPRDIEAMAGDLDETNSRYLDTGRKLAEKHGARFIDFVPDAHLRSADFYDLDHLVRSGREVYQAWLAYETALILNAEHGSPAAYVASPSPASTASAGGAILGRGYLWPVVLGVVLVGVALGLLRTRAVVARSRPRRRRTV
jgi:hypothetical protein